MTSDNCSKPTDLRSIFDQIENGRFSRTIVNRVWERLTGRGVVHPVDGMANRPWSEDLLDHLAVYLADQKYDLRKLIEHVATSRAYQSRHAVADKEPAGEGYVFRGPGVRRLTAEQFVDAVWQITRTAPPTPAAPVKLPPDDPAVPAERRATLVAKRDAQPGRPVVYRFDIRMQGPDETVFFDV